MYKCECGSVEFKVKMITSDIVNVTTESGNPEYTLKTEDTKNIEFSGYFICVKCQKFHLDINSTKQTDDTNKRCICGNMRFSANQVCYHDVVVDSNNCFIRNIFVSEAETPYGPYHCIECGAEYEDLDELKK